VVESLLEGDAIVDWARGLARAPREAPAR